VHGLCEWYTNPKTCWLGIFCAPCLACSTARKLDAGGDDTEECEGPKECRGWKYLVLSCLLPCFAMYKLRDKARRRTGDVNPDETCGDACRHCLAGLFCTACVNCQLANELGTCKKPPKDVGTGDSISMASDKKREMEAASKFLDKLTEAKKSPAKKSPPKKSPAKTSPAKTSPAKTPPRKTPPFKKKQTELVFKQYDEDKDGYITKTEMEKGELSKNLTKEQIEKVFARFDADGDGRLSYSEFKKMIVFD